MNEVFKKCLTRSGLPWHIIIIEIILFLSAIIISLHDLSNHAQNSNSLLVNILSPFAVVLTLGIVIIYTYYAYLLARYQIVPSVSFELIQAPDDPYHFGFMMANPSKYPVKCWCNLNATTHGLSLKYKGFYSGDEPRLLQPECSRMGHFRINDLLANNQYKIDLLKKEANDKNYKQLLHMNVEFWYSPLIDENIITTIRDPYYFDFRDDKLKLDF